MSTKNPTPNPCPLSEWLGESVRDAERIAVAHEEDNRRYLQRTLDDGVAYNRRTVRTAERTPSKVGPSRLGPSRYRSTASDATRLMSQSAERRFFSKVETAERIVRSARYRRSVAVADLLAELA